MDFLNRAGAQFNDLFRSMTPSARITAALLLAVVVVSMGYLFKARSSGPDSYLLGGHPFSAAEMPQVQGALAKAGLKDFALEGNLIRIPRTDQAAYIAALADANLLPSSFGDRFMTIVERQSPFSSRYQSEQVLKHARNAMLAHSISRMDGILSADVFTDVTDKRGLRPEQIASASVNVHTIGGQPLTAKQAQAIRSLVAGAITTLSRDKVTVIDGQGRTFSGEDGDGSLASLDDPYLSRKLQYEEKIQNDLHSLLSYVPGIQVSVNVDLNKERGRREESQKFDPKPVPVRSTTEETEVATESNATAGRPGFDAQQPNRGAQLAGGGRGSTQRETHERTDTASITSTDITRSEYVGLTPERVSVSVVVPTTYFESIWRQMNPPQAGAEPRQPTEADLAPIEERETQKIRALVFNKIPHATAELGPDDLVAVRSFRPIPIAPIAEPTATDVAMAWLADSWGTLAMLGLVAFSLLMLRSIVRAPTISSPSAPSSPGVSLPNAPMIAGTIAPAESEETSAKSRLRRRASSGPTLRDDLVEIVREDPDAAANILKGWIGNVG